MASVNLLFNCTHIHWCCGLPPGPVTQPLSALNIRNIRYQPCAQHCALCCRCTHPPNLFLLSHHIDLSGTNSGLYLSLEIITGNTASESPLSNSEHHPIQDWILKSVLTEKVVFSQIYSWIRYAGAVSEPYVLLVSPAQLAFPPALEMKAVSKGKPQGRRRCPSGNQVVQWSVPLKARLTPGEVRCPCLIRDMWGPKVSKGTRSDTSRSLQGPCSPGTAEQLSFAFCFFLPSEHGQFNSQKLHIQSRTSRMDFFLDGLTHLQRPSEQGHGHRGQESTL